MTEEWLVSIVVAVVMVVGLIGTLFPVLPGILMMWAVALGYGFSTEFGPVGLTVMAVMTVLLLVSFVLAYMLPKRAADDAGASRTSQLVGFVGAVIGFFVIPVAGVIVGALAGVMIGEYLEKGDTKLAWASTMATAKGFGINAIAQFCVGFAMLLLWVVWAGAILF